MSKVSLIANTGIQYIRIPNVLIDLDADVAKRINFREIEIDQELELDPVYYFQMNDKFVKRRALISNGFMDPYTNYIEDENNILFDLFSELDVCDREDILSISSLDSSLKKCKDGKDPIDVITNQWLPLPYFDEDGAENLTTPTNWSRIKIIPKKKNRNKLTVDLLLAFDTTVSENFNEIESPIFVNNESYKKFGLCGYSNEKIESLDDSLKNRTNDIVIPLMIYEFCSKNNHWLNNVLLRIIHGDSFDIATLEEGKRLKYLVYYMYLIYYLHQSKILPLVQLYSDQNINSIDVNLILDIGNSRTYGLLAEDPINESFSNAKILQMTDLGTGEIYEEPFDMRLAFRKEDYGGFNPFDSTQFTWPSVLCVGQEAQRYIYNDKGSYKQTDDANTYYSSPKRYLWDDEPFKVQWEFSQTDEFDNRSRTIWMEGISQQFHSDGSFANNPDFLGAKSCYSRQSLMTFAFMEILLQATMQANSLDFRQAHGQEFIKRKISRIIITSPTAMPKSEQVTLRRCAEEAAIVLHRFYSKTYRETFDDKNRKGICEIIPSVRDLALPASSSDDKRNWGYDEASCCQMVYLYSELKRFLGNSKDLFDLYGHIRTDINLEGATNKKSLTIGSVDIGAGTTDIMICNYSASLQGDTTITPMPLYWDSFRFSGDDLVKAIITQVIIEDYGKESELGCSGVISNKLKEMDVPDISSRLHTFFDDTASMSYLARKMRKDFTVQIAIPIAYKMLDLLQKGEFDRVLSFDDFFTRDKPQEELLNYFEQHFGFRFEELNWKFSVNRMNEIIQKVFEPYLRKWTAILYAYGCDIVLLGGRPTSLQKVYDLFLKLYPVSPNRLISMNNYRVGNWYPGTDGVGYFGDRKSLVAVGALIAYLAESGKLNNFKLNTKYFKKNVLPTADYVGYINPQTGDIQHVFLEPSINRASLKVDTFPIYLGCCKMNVPGYPSRILYKMNINEKRISELMSDKNIGLSIEQLSEEVDTFKHRITSRMPITLRLTREYKEDKELLEIESAVNNEKEDISPAFIQMRPQSLVEDVSDWLNTGRFILKIGGK